MTMRILILGGYGVFGGRLAELLADRPDLELLICGRDLARAEAFCTRYQGEARAFPGALNRRDIADALFISVPTVKRHLTTIFTKLDLPSRSALAIYAHTHDLA